MYLNITQVAESFGVSEGTVQDWVHREKMPHVHDQGRILFEQSQVMEWTAKKGLRVHSGFLSEQPAQPLHVTLAPLLRRGGIWRDVLPSTIHQVFMEILRKLTLPQNMEDLFNQRMSTPGGVSITPVGRGFALPHPTTRLFLGKDFALIALILLKKAYTGVTTPDNVPITRMLFFISPTPRQHTNMLGLLARSIDTGAMLRPNAHMSDEEIFQTIATARIPELRPEAIR
ncbi:MAG: helix-turn-helix domain-containing protein [Desulfomicrobium sp.]|jgi:PTS system nitrogen regulatory IIA component|nr:helix-turn-helix domain-containing protein [Desulfomicrobium sp.]NLV96565.1 helix-turn-helix domain-containing protein [Desulfovibrionales bacterium]